MKIHLNCKTNSAAMTNIGEKKIPKRHFGKCLMLAPENVLEEYRKLVPNGKVKTKIFRVTNRLGDGDGDWTIPYDHKKIDRKWYIQGCAMKAGRILRQMEILVNGQVVLCCDDADGKTNHGNVFEIGIEKAWQNLQNEHTLIFEQKWS